MLKGKKEKKEILLMLKKTSLIRTHSFKFRNYRCCNHDTNTSK